MKSSRDQKVLLLGATGMLGSTLTPFMASRGHEVATHGRFDGIASYRADLDSIHETSSLLDSVKPDVIVNLIGLTDVDRCETRPNEAYGANFRGELQNILRTVFVHLAFKVMRLIFYINFYRKAT